MLTREDTSVVSEKGNLDIPPVLSLRDSLGAASLSGRITAASGMLLEQCLCLFMDQVTSSSSVRGGQVRGQTRLEGSQLLSCPCSL